MDVFIIHRVIKQDVLQFIRPGGTKKCIILYLSRQDFIQFFCDEQDWNFTCQWWIVPDFGGRSLDTDPNFGQYRHFCSTIINICTHINPNKTGTQNYLRQISSAVDIFYLKKSDIWSNIGTTKCIKNVCFCKLTFSRGLSFKKLVISWTIWNFWYFTITNVTDIFCV